MVEVNVHKEIKVISRELHGVVLQCFERESCWWDLGRIFGSHCDWHSSVHAHWMLLSYYRIMGSEAAANRLLNRMTSNAIELERQFLLKNPNFELPYGQSWLLLLLRELENYGLYFLDFKKETLERVLQWLREAEFPQRLQNSYHSWMISYFLLKKSKACNINDLKAIDEKFERVTYLEDKNDTKDFFSSESLFTLLKQAPKTSLNFERSEIPNHIQNVNCHLLGKYISQSWLTPQTNRNCLAGTVQFLKPLIQEPALWKSDFDLVGHWVPQFLWFGVWLALGEQTDHPTQWMLKD